MTAPRAQLGPWHRRALYGSALLVWLSGALWLVDKHFRQRQTDFGLQPPPTQALWLELHGAAAMAVLVVVGSLLPEHVRLGWKRGQRLPSGTSALAVLTLLAASGWGLYYFGDEALRRGTSVFHWGAGLPLPLLIAAHSRLGRRQ